METVNTPLHIDTVLLSKGKNTFRAINHSLRQQMMELIHKNGRMIVTDIYVKLRLEQPVASQHLAILRREHFLNTERQGKRIFYSVNYQRLNQVYELSKRLTGH